MAKFITVQGTTSFITHIFVQDATATNGSGLTGLSFSSSGLSMAYVRAGSAGIASVTLTGSGLNLGTYVSGAFIEVNAGTMPGVYEFHVPNAAVTTGAGRVVFIAKGNAAMAPVPFEIQLDPVNGQFTPILAATTHSGATIPIVSTVARVLLTDTVSTVTRALLVDTVSTVARALLVDTATVVLNVNTCTNVLNPVLVTSGTDPGMISISSGRVYLVATTHAGVTIPIVSTVARVLLADTVSTVTRALLVDTVSTVARALLVDTASVVLNVNTATNIVNPVTITAGQLFIKRNSTLPGFMFLMTDTASHGPKTALSVTGQYSLTGGAFNAMASVGTEVSNGWYKIDIAAGEVNAPICSFRLTGAGADDRCITFITQT